MQTEIRYCRQCGNAYEFTSEDAVSDYSKCPDCGFVEKWMNTSDTERSIPQRAFFTAEQAAAFYKHCNDILRSDNVEETLKELDWQPILSIPDTALDTVTGLVEKYNEMAETYSYRPLEIFALPDGRRVLNGRVLWRRKKFFSLCKKEDEMKAMAKQIAGHCERRYLITESVGQDENLLEDIITMPPINHLIQESSVINLLSR